MKKLLIALIILALGGAGVYGYYKYGKPEDKATVNQTALSQGNIIQQVQSTGTLEALRTVQVGSQVSGVVQDLHGVDFNSIVKKDQVIATLDPSLLQVQVDIQEANIQRQDSDIANQQVQLENDKKNLERTEQLAAKGLANTQQLEQARLQVKTREAQIVSAQKQKIQTEAALAQAKLNVSYCTIRAPIDGVVVDRKVDVGQTVQSSMTTPQFFTIATDLTQLKLTAGVDEADIGYIRPNMRVTFTVESYPNTTFQGFVDAVRLNASTANNVVTYPVWITVNNPDLKLRPSMTANIRIVVDQAENVVKVPNQALRFRPTSDIYAWLGMPAPAPGQGARGRGQNADAAGRPGGQGANANALGGTPAGGAATGQVANGPVANGPAGQNAQANAGDSQNRRTRQPGQGGPAQGAAGPGGQGGQNLAGGAGGRGGNNAGAGPGGGGGGRFANMTPEERQKMREQFAAGGGQRGQGGPGGQGGGRGQGGQGFGRGNTNLTPEQMAQFRQQFGARGQGGGPNGQNGGRGGRGNRQGAANEVTGAVTPLNERNADKIDELFAPVQRPTTRGQVWVYNEKAADPKDKLKQINVTLGLTDGQTSELIAGEGLSAGVMVVTGVVPPPSAIKAQQQNNLLGGPQRGFGGQTPGGFGGPGGGPGGGGGGGGRGGGGGGGRGGN